MKKYIVEVLIGFRPAKKYIVETLEAAKLMESYLEDETTDVIIRQVVH